MKAQHLLLSGKPFSVGIEAVWTLVEASMVGVLLPIFAPFFVTFKFGWPIFALAESHSMGIVVVLDFTVRFDSVAVRR